MNKEKGRFFTVNYNHKLLDLELEMIRQIFETSINFALEIVEQNIDELLEEIEVFMGKEIHQTDKDREVQQSLKVVDRIHKWLTIDLIHDVQNPRKKRNIVNYMEFINRDDALAVLNDGRIVCMPIFHALAETIIRIIDIGLSKGHRGYYKDHIEKNLLAKLFDSISYYRQQVLYVDNVKTGKALFLKALSHYGANPLSEIRNLGNGLDGDGVDEGGYDISPTAIKKRLRSLPTIGWL